MARAAERCAVILLAVVATSLLAFLARPSPLNGVSRADTKSHAVPTPIALDVRLARPPAAMGLTAAIEGKLDPGPLVGSDHRDVVAEALAALPIAEGSGMVLRGDDELMGNLLVPLGSTGGDSGEGLVLDPTGAGAGTPGKAMFMGAEATGRRFLIIADRSSSMEGEKFQHVIAEIGSTIKGLKPNARFYVIFFDFFAVPCPAKRWLSGPRDAFDLQQWMNNVGTSDGTNPVPAFEIAFSQIHPRPDAIFFMTDGEFPAAVADEIPRLNSGRRVVPIHSISFVDKSAEAWLRKIADDSKGTYRHVDLKP